MQLKDLEHLLEFKVDTSCPNGPSKVCVKPRSQPCDDCGIIVSNRRVQHKKYASAPHWRSQCMSCNLFKDENGNFTIDPKQQHHYFKALNKK